MMTINLDSAPKDLELAIKVLQQLSLEDSMATGSSSSSKENSSCTCSIEKKRCIHVKYIWGDMLVKELMNAQSIEDAKARAVGVMQGFNNKITAKETAKTEERLMQENWIFKHQLRQNEKQGSKGLLKALQLKIYTLTLC